MQFETIFFLMVVSHALSLGVILLVLWRGEHFLHDALVFMKARNIEDVLSASSILNDKPKRPAEENVEVVPGQDDDDTFLMDVQQKHRNKHVKSLGAE